MNLRCLSRYFGIGSRAISSELLSNCRPTGRVMTLVCGDHYIYEPIIVQPGVLLSLDPGAAIINRNPFADAVILERGARITGGTIRCDEPDMTESLLKYDGIYKYDRKIITGADNISLIGPSDLGLAGTGLKMECDNSDGSPRYIQWIRNSNINISGLNVGIDMHTFGATDNALSFINGNLFRDIGIDWCTTGISLKGNSNVVNQIYGNVFSGIQYESLKLPNRIIYAEGQGHIFDNVVDFDWAGDIAYEFSLSSTRISISGPFITPDKIKYEQGGYHSIRSPNHPVYIPQMVQEQRPNANQFQPGETIYNSSAQQINTSSGVKWRSADGKGAD